MYGEKKIWKREGVGKEGIGGGVLGERMSGIWQEMAGGKKRGVAALAGKDSVVAVVTHPVQAKCIFNRNGNVAPLR